MPQLALPQATIDYRVIRPDTSHHPPVVFVHGILVDSRLWTAAAETLAEQGYRCYLPNLPLGSHTIPVTDAAVLSPTRMADLVHDFITELGLQDVTLVGNDTGGGICQLVVDAHPERIGRMVLTNCDAFEQFPPFPFTLVFALLRGPRSIKVLAEQLRLRPLRHSPLGYGLLMTRPDPRLTDSWLAPARRDVRIRLDLATLLRAVAATDLTDVGTRLHRFAKPVTLVWGQRDRCFTPELGRRLAQAFPASTLVAVPDATTFVALDNPAAVAHAVADITAASTSP